MKQNGNLLNETFFELLEECSTWNPSVDVNKMNEGTFIVDRVGPLFNKTIHYFNYVTIHSWYEIILCVSVDFCKKRANLWLFYSYSNRIDAVSEASNHTLTVFSVNIYKNNEDKLKIFLIVLPRSW